MVSSVHPYSRSLCQTLRSISGSCSVFCFLLFSSDLLSFGPISEILLPNTIDWLFYTIYDVFYHHSSLEFICYDWTAIKYSVCSFLRDEEYSYVAAWSIRLLLFSVSKTLERLVHPHSLVHDYGFTLLKCCCSSCIYPDIVLCWFSFMIQQQCFSWCCGMGWTCLFLPSSPYIIMTISFLPCVHPYQATHHASGI
jgi:hypothetical protein